jgi:hypothetical protein
MFISRRYTAFANVATDYLSLADAKSHLRVTSSSDDTYISGLISMAIEACSNYLGYSIRKGTAKYGFDAYTGSPAMVNPINGTNIPSGNYLRLNTRCLSVVSVSYVNDSQAVTAFDGSSWLVSPDPMGSYSRNIFFEDAPSSITDDTIKYIVEITEGFNPVGTASVDPDTIFPATIKHAALLLVAQYYDNRQAIVTGTIQTEMSLGFHYLLDPYKIQIMI